ncbi:putative DER1-like protein [Cryptosporidium felis]|nr:putative DER1-like protein [Cryptosporidium felis]
MFEDSSPQGWYRNLPPITRSILTITFVLTFLVTFGMLNPWHIVFDWGFVIRRAQVWRFFTSFFFVGPFSLGWVMSQWMLTSFSSKLERSGAVGSSSGSYLYFVLLLMGSINLIGTAFEYPSGRRVGGSSLIFGIIYYWSKKSPTSLVSLWGFTLQAYQLPYALLFLDVLTGNSMIDDIIGLLAGHSYFYLRDVIYENNSDNFLSRTPKSLDKFVDYSSFLIKRHIYDFSGISNHPNVINPNPNLFRATSAAFSGGSSQPRAFSGRGFRLGGEGEGASGREAN